MGADPGQETGGGQDQGKGVQGGMEVGVEQVGAGTEIEGGETGTSRPGTWRSR